MKIKIFRKIRKRNNPFLSSNEGRIFIIGIILTIVFLLGLSLNFLIFPDYYQILIGMTATHLIFGRVAGLSFGYASGLNHMLVIPVAIIIETLMVLIFFPLFVFSVRKLFYLKSLANIILKIQDAAKKNKDKINKFGIVGLFVFVFIPFWMTGPLVGCAIGYFMGLAPWFNLFIVISATSIAIGAWAMLLGELHEKIAFYNPLAPMLVLLLIISLVVFVNILYFKKNRKTKTKNK